jgi:hypothetical protein
MTSSSLDRRRAERFAQLVDSPDRLPASGDSPTDDADLVAIGRRLSSVPIPGQVDPTFRAEFRAVLVAAAERQHAARAAADTTAQPAPATRAARPSARLARARTLLGSSPEARRSRTRRAIIAGIAAGAIAVTGISSASDDSVPGDALYGMKRSTERAQLALAGSDTGRGELLLGFARTRADEAHEVRGDAAAFDRLLTESDSQTIEAVSLLTRAAIERKSEAPLDIVARFVDRQRPVLAGLPAGADLAEAARAEVSVAVLDAMANRVEKVRADLRKQARAPDAPPR